MIEYSFFDNQSVGAADLNALSANVLGSGVLGGFSDGIPYNISKLNDIYYANMTEGILPQSDNSLKVTVSDGVATIANGKCVFPDGSYAEITGTETASVTANAINYVYLKSDTALNTAYLVCSSTPPAENANVVPLAEIAADGITITDRRRYAKGKVPHMYASDNGLTAKQTFTVTTGNAETFQFYTDKTYNFMFFTGKSDWSGGHYAEDNFGFIHLTDGTGCSGFTCGQTGVYPCSNYTSVVYKANGTAEYKRYMTITQNESGYLISVTASTYDHSYPLEITIYMV